MRSAISLTRLALCLSTLTSVSSAWPEWLPDIDALVMRADSTASGASPSPTPAPSAPSSGKNNPETPISTNLNTAGESSATTDASQTGTQTGKQSGSKKTTTQAAQTTTFPANAEPGGVNLIVPATIVTPTPLYMIGDNVTLSWNYTSLLATPTAVDVLLTCTVNQATWTLTNNMSFHTDVSYVWNSADTNDDVENPLLTDMYTMIIKDSNASVTSFPSPGYLGSWSSFKFGMYQNQPYVSYNDWTCPGACSRAANLNTHAIGFMLTMASITFLSFTWFVTGLGIH